MHNYSSSPYLTETLGGTIYNLDVSFALSCHNYSKCYL